MRNWQDLWEEAAREERLRMEGTSAEELLRQVASGRYGSCYQVWGVLAGRTTLEAAGWILLGILEREPDPLQRYHCAAALLDLAGLASPTPADLSARPGGMGDSLASLRGELEARIGPPPAGGEA